MEPAEPRIVSEARASPEKKKWEKAMKCEMDSDERINRYKARLVTKRFTQKYGLDYDERFCPVVRFESVRSIIALAGKHGLKSHHMDITIAFLNGQLKEDIYMKQLEGFAQKEEEHLV